ncbi:MAG TPA: hypothetical protein VJJ78_02155 [Candidatus Saccharimonadales bacterium]|nr:hypothetical protein [Candidatus Saccharimonadales bacterium]
MIQFNLLPNVKLSYIKARQTKRFVTMISAISAVVMLVILVLLLLLVYGIQKRHINNLNEDIAKYSSELQGTTDLNKILTIQNQLNSLTGLHDKKAVAARLFGYVSQITPTQTTIAKLNVDFSTNIISIVGVADNLSVVNKFTDTLKFTNFTSENNQTGSAFSDVVLTNFSRSDQKAQYQLDAKFNPIIFDSASSVSLTVPKIISTRSETEKPGALFEQLDSEPNQEGQ